MGSDDAEDDCLDGFGEWSETQIDEAVDEVKKEMDEDFQRTNQEESADTEN